MYDDAVAMYREMIDNVYSLGRGSQVHHKFVRACRYPCGEGIDLTSLDAVQLKPEHTMLVKLFLPFSQVHRVVRERSGNFILSFPLQAIEKEQGAINMGQSGKDRSGLPTAFAVGELICSWAGLG